LEAQVSREVNTYISEVRKEYNVPNTQDVVILTDELDTLTAEYKRGNTKALAKLILLSTYMLQQEIMGSLDYVSKVKMLINKAFGIK
jgi:hypothetical protein